MMSRHMYHVCGQPWIRTTAGPWPAVTWWIVTSPRLAKSCSKCEVIGGHVLGSWARQLCRASTGILVPSTLSSVQRPRFRSGTAVPTPCYRGTCPQSHDAGAAVGGTSCVQSVASIRARDFDDFGLGAARLGRLIVARGYVL